MFSPWGRRSGSGSLRSLHSRHNHPLQSWWVHWTPQHHHWDLGMAENLCNFQFLGFCTTKPKLLHPFLQIWNNKLYKVRKNRYLAEPLGVHLLEWGELRWREWDGTWWCRGDTCLVLLSTDWARDQPWVRLCDHCWQLRHFMVRSQARSGVVTAASRNTAKPVISFLQFLLDHDRSFILSGKCVCWTAGDITYQHLATDEVWGLERDGHWCNIWLDKMIWRQK